MKPLTNNNKHSAQVLFKNKKGLYYVSFYQQYPVFKFLCCSGFCVLYSVSLMSHKTSTHNFNFKELLIKYIDRYIFLSVCQHQNSISTFHPRFHFQLKNIIITTKRRRGFSFFFNIRIVWTEQETEYLHNIIHNIIQQQTNHHPIAFLFNIFIHSVNLSY